MTATFDQPDDDFKAFVYEQLAVVGKAVSSPQRLILLNILVNGEHTVDDLATCSGNTVANTSSHLQVLKRAGLVTARRSGKHRVYVITSPMVRTFFLQLRELATGSLAELREALGAVSVAPTRATVVGREELLALIAAGDSLIIDVRPPSEYARGHLPGAVSVPLRELHDYLHELPRDRPIITYCRGPLCLLADTAVSLLNEAGFQARRTDEDVPTWERAGLPVGRATEVGER